MKMSIVPYLLIISLPLVAHTSSSASPVSNIGRYETSAKQCEYRLKDGSKKPCKVVQIDPKTSSLAGIRFIGRGETHGSGYQLTFVANSPTQPIPLRCIAGECELNGDEKTWTATVSSVAESMFDGRGLAQGLPRAWPVKGECKLKNNQLRCIAKAMTGKVFTGEAQL